eukprot:SAG22_NODE_4330_length_1301_cov_1.148918_3_plen_172_part_01
MSDTLKAFVADRQVKYMGLSPDKMIQEAVAEFGSGLCLASSLSVEDQILTDLFLKADPKARIFVLDTGRLHQETYDVMQESMARFNFRYDVYAPDQVQLQDLIEAKGPNLFYESIENRKACCGVRKMQPLAKALGGAKAWMTGLRKAQSVTRVDMQVLEWDAGFNLVKLNPL